MRLESWEAELADYVDWPSEIRSADTIVYFTPVKQIMGLTGQAG